MKPFTFTVIVLNGFLIDVSEWRSPPQQQLIAKLFFELIERNQLTVTVVLLIRSHQR